MALSSQLSSVVVTPFVNRPSYDSCCGPGSSGDPDVFRVMSLGQPFCYPIPSFDVLAVKLRHMRIEGCTKEDEFHSYDVFIRENSSLNHSLPTWLTVLDWTIVDPNEFSVCVKIDDLKLVPQGVFIVWEWEWSDSEPDSAESEQESVNTYCSADGDINPYLQSESEREGDSEPEADTGSFVLPELTHTITFKCMGTTYHPESQDALSKVADLMKKGQEVPVKLVKEPDNIYDSRAIAFQCQLKGHWIRIGYIVKEALEHVHKALTEKKIINVKFDWVKYLVIWSKSGPGFYAGIRISLNGEWPKEVQQCKSTR